ncbi:sugar-binding transcriptional regulator [Phyllobacterium zundukense]|uniref:sugar-binding transcriptional regulator n=1 Tax=Phyllobacterium zundukense TaxID=1867719 RepID=UPI001F428F1B|nr:sugar-binding transcriptional regulator [Phyllobacterium zundukense]
MADRRKRTNGTAHSSQKTPSDAGQPDTKISRMRMRAAWMYYIEQMTQNEIAEILGVGRVTIVRMLAEARARNEVKIGIQGYLSDLVALERQVEKQFGLEKVIIAPLSHPDNDPIPAIAAATGDYLSSVVSNGMRVGVGWGRTLLNTLSYIEAKALEDFTVISLLGGISQPRRFNPAEFAWQFAQLFQGDGYLIPAPAMVDSIETKTALIERCGLKSVFEMAEDLDLVLLSVGAIETASSTPYHIGFLNEGHQSSLAARGAVGDLLFHFYDKAGRLVDHPIHDLVMSVGIDTVQRVPARVLTSGGKEKIRALYGAMTLVRPTVFITDEESARRLLVLAEQEKG